MYHFLMPSDRMSPRQVDPVFRLQAEQLRAQGYDVSLVNDDVFRDGDPIRNIVAGSIVIYRGWMVKLDEYRRLNDSICSAGATLLTDPQSYALTHHLPNWYETLAEFTAETVVIKSSDDLVQTIAQLDWGGYFLKDFVKSLKVAGGSIVYSEADARRWVEQMIEYRDELEGGICIRRIEAFAPESERRYFVLNGVAHSAGGGAIPPPVQAAVDRIRSPFYSVDVAVTTDNRFRIVEIGDGQVSDLVGWTAEQFAAMWPLRS